MSKKRSFVKKSHKNRFGNYFFEVHRQLLNHVKVFTRVCDRSLKFFRQKPSLSSLMTQQLAPLCALFLLAPREEEESGRGKGKREKRGGEA